MGSDDPIDKLAEVLTALQHVDGVEADQSTSRQLEILRDVQTQMVAQLRLHDAQIAALREVIDLLSRRSKR